MHGHGFNRREVDGNRFIGVTEAGIQQRRFDAFPALANGSVGHADGDEIAGATAGIHVHLDVDQVRFNPEDSRAARAKQGHTGEVVQAGRIRLRPAPEEGEGACSPIAATITNFEILCSVSTRKTFPLCTRPAIS